MSTHDTPNAQDPSSKASEPGPAKLPDRQVVFEDWLAAVSLVLLVLITFSNVIVRYLTDRSFAWTEELSISLMVILTMTAASAAMSRDRHVRLEILIGRGPAQRRRLLRVIAYLATIIGFSILTYLSGRLAYDDYRYGVTSPGIGVDQWLYTVWLPVFSAFIALRALQRLLREFRHQ